MDDRDLGRSGARRLAILVNWGVDSFSPLRERAERLAEAYPGDPERNPDTLARIVLAKSEAYEALYRELYRYGKGELEGRSYLVAGHRGAGKTTTVLKAIADVRSRLREERSPRLLMVRIYAPDFLPKNNDEKAGLTDASARSTANGSVNTTVGGEKNLAGERDIQSGKDEIPDEPPDDTPEKWQAYYAKLVPKTFSQEIAKRFYPAVVDLFVEL